MKYVAGAALRRKRNDSRADAAIRHVRAQPIEFLDPAFATAPPTRAGSATIDTAGWIDWPPSSRPHRVCLWSRP
jgi:hypothetical protein